MPRRSARQSVQSTAKRISSAETVENPRKRSRPADVGVSSSSVKYGPKRSHYFDGSNDKDMEGEDEDEDEAVDDSDQPEQVSDVEAMSYEDSVSEAPSAISDDDGADEPPKRKGKATAKVATRKRSAALQRGSNLKNDDDTTTDLPPGIQIIIKKPKARSAGKTPYTDHAIHPNTLLFLEDLGAHNSREWFKMHDPDYRASLNDWNTFVGVLTQKLCEIDDTIPELPIKDITFRVHRDVRFSPDKTPYKPYFSAAWSRTGRKGPYAHYFLQIQPGGNSFVGGGLWHPEAPAVAALRREIDQNPQRLKSVLMDERIRKELLDNCPKREEKVVKAFVSSPTNAESALKTKPKGYDSTHPDIELLRLRNFTVGRKIEDSEILDGQGFLDRVTSLFATIYPFITCLNRTVLPDPEDSEGGDDEEEQSETSTEET